MALQQHQETYPKSIRFLFFMKTFYFLFFPSSTLCFTSENRWQRKLFFIPPSPPQAKVGYSNPFTQPQRLPPRSSTAAFLYSSSLRRDVQLPLLDLVTNLGEETDSDNVEKLIQPLPSSHLPDDLSTLNLYGMQLSLPLHQKVVDAAIDLGEGAATEAGEGMRERCFGHLAYKPPPGDDDDADNFNSLIGAIGCAAQVLVSADETAASIIEQQPEGKQELTDANVSPKTVLCRGLYRFVVKDVVKTIPFPVVIVDELVDGDGGDNTGKFGSEGSASDNSKVDIDDDEDEDVYLDLSPSELMQRCMSGIQSLVQQQLEGTAEAEENMSPLEQSILEETGGLPLSNAERQAALEAATVWDVFKTGLVDYCSTPAEQYFAIAFLAAEMANFNNALRRQMLVMTNSVERLRLVVKELELAVGMTAAKKMADAITDASDESSRDLKVGKPPIPAWARTIKKGAKIEYFWNEEWGWCQGQVMEDPALVVDELLLKIYFEIDGSEHILPLSGEEKVRWRPPSSTSPPPTGEFE